MIHLLRAYLPHMIALALLALAILAGYQWVTGLGYRAQAAALKVELLSVTEQLTGCKANSASRLAQIEAQINALDEAKRQGDRRRMVAIEARDAALLALDDTQARYARLQSDWPQDCVSAVERVRQEYGL